MQIYITQILHYNIFMEQKRNAGVVCSVHTVYKNRIKILSLCHSQALTLLTKGRQFQESATGM